MTSMACGATHCAYNRFMTGSRLGQGDDTFGSGAILKIRESCDDDPQS
jgi:hypothetical protein